MPDPPPVTRHTLFLKRCLSSILVRLRLSKDDICNGKFSFAYVRNVSNIQMWSRDVVVRVLCRTVLFGGLSAAEIDSIAACAVQKTCASGQVLYVLGDEPAGIYLISSG